MARSLSAFLLVVISHAAVAQSLEPVLVVKVKGEKAPESQKLPLSALHVEARILGHIAETKMTMTFENPHDRVLAGDLYFPLPEGSTVSGYALDIKGVLIDGVVVEKHKGRQVYEKIVRMGIDPGLVEYVKGNNFKTRVFPIPARGSRTIRVDYVSDLVAGRDSALYRLPLGVGRKVKDFKLRVEVVKTSGVPKVTQGALANFEFKKWRQSYVAEVASKDASLDKDLAVTVPVGKQQKVLVERAPDGNVYFCINDLASEHRRTMKEMVPPTPKRVVVLWDASGSRGKTDHGKELDFLRAYFGQRRLSKTTVEIDLVLFRNVAAKPEHFVIKNGNVDGVIARLGTVKYDGGTQMASVSSGATAPPDFFLLFTDGISNFGLEEPGELKAPAYVISSGSGANHPFLRYIAMKTGGVYFNLDRIEPKTAAQGIGFPTYAFLSASADEGRVKELYPRVSQAARGRIAVVGQLRREAATVTLRYGYGSGARAENTFKYQVTAADAVEGDLLRRYWAQKKLADLMIRPKKYADEIVKLGKKHSIVTPGTSLIVLDRLEQYVEHRIRPPKSLPKMRAQWEDIVEKRGRQEEKNEKEKLERIVKLWQGRVKWWETEFKYPKDFKYKPSRAKKGNGGREPAAGDEAPPPPAAAEPSRPATQSALPGGTAQGEANMDAPARRAYKPGDTSRAAEPGIAIKAWDPKTPYLKALKAVPADKVFGVYMAQRKSYGDSPAFFLDCADFLLRQKRSSLALQVLSNVAEMELESPALLRILAHRLAQVGRLDLSAMLFEEVLRLRPEEPQSYRDLALVLARQKKYTRAIELLYKVVLEKWDRFAEIELIALMELNALIPRAKAAGVKEIPIDPRLVKLLDVDIRIILSWDADVTDIDLWVIEPSGEKAYYSHRRTTIGGNFSRDFTQGYGPEEYVLRRAMNGAYKVKANYYGSGAPKLAGAVTLQLDVFTNYGRPNERRKSITLRLTKKKEVIDVGEIEF